MNRKILILLALCLLAAALCPALAESGGALDVVDRMELKYASGFSVDYCAGGYKIITDGLNRSFLWVPEGAETPETDLPVLQAPLTEIGCFSTTHAVLFKALDQLERIRLVTWDRDGWYIEQMRQQMDRGETVYVGRSKEPDYELILSVHPQLTLITANSSSSSAETLQKFDELDLPWIAALEHLENHPLGRLEWVKLAGALMDMEEEANAFFSDAEARVEAVMAASVAEEARPSFNQAFLYKGKVYIRNDDDYTNEMISLAGGRNILEGIRPGEGGTSTITLEDYYARTRDTDVLIYDTTSDVSVSSIGDLLAYGDYLSDIKAIREGNVWGIQPYYYQNADDVATMIEELHQILYSPEPPQNLKYYFKLEP